MKRNGARSRINGSLSLIIPGVGQLNNGRILWLIHTSGFWIGTGGTLAPTANNYLTYTAYSYARDHRVHT